MSASKGLKLQKGLPPVRLATKSGHEERPCAFRDRGLCLAVFDAEEGTFYSVTHEASGTRIGNPQANGVHALALVAALFSLPVDWKRDGEGMKAQLKSLDEQGRSLMWAIQSGRIQFMEMGRA